MINRIAVFILLSGLLCAGQAPSGSSSSSPSSQGTTNTGQADSAQGTGPEQIMAGAVGLRGSSLPGTTNPGGMIALFSRLLGHTTNLPEQQPMTEKEQPRTIRPILEKTEFQRFVEDSVGHPMAVYGRELFD